MNKAELTFDTVLTDMPICPHCGFTHWLRLGALNIRLNRDLNIRLNREWYSEMEDGEHECARCEKLFSLEVVHSLSFTTAKINDVPTEMENDA